MPPRSMRAVEDGGGDDGRAAQVEAGIDIVNDGEMSKPSYATYIKDRLSGFGGDGNSYSLPGPRGFPRRARRKVFGDAGRKRRRAPACNGPITVKDMEAPRIDARAAQGRGWPAAAQTFMSAASPGVTVAVLRATTIIPSHEDYVFAIAEGLRHEYETIAAAGITLQIDCPDLAMGRHVQYRRSRPAATSASGSALNIEALNQPSRNIPAEQLRMHLCWGNYPGPHHCDVPFADIIDLVWTRQAADHPVRGRQSAPRARVSAVRDGQAARGQGAGARRDRVPVELYRASRAGRAAHRAATPIWSGASR